MKVYIFLALMISTAFAAPMMNGNFSPEERVKRFKAALNLFAPENWVNTFNSISEEGQKCFLTAVKTQEDAQLYHSDNFDAIKQDLAIKCPAFSNELNNFVDIMSQTYKSLPSSFVEAMKEWQSQSRSTGQKIKETVANNPQQDGSNFKQYIGEFANSAATFTGKLAVLSEADRQQISNAFPKLQPFFNGDRSIELFNKLNQVFTSIGSGKVDIPAVKSGVKEVKTILQAIWEQYSTLNAEGIKRAGEILGKDISEMVKSKLDKEFNGFESNGPKSHPFADIIKQKIQGGNDQPGTQN